MVVERPAEDSLRVYQKPGALRRELDFRVTEASVQNRGLVLKHGVGAWMPE